MNVLKSICGVVTILPDRAAPSREFCSDPAARADLPLSSCGDMIFSGHAAHIFLLLSLIHYNQHIGTYTTVVIGVTVSLLVLVTRMHYTVDIITAVFCVGCIQYYMPYERPHGHGASSKKRHANRSLYSSDICSTDDDSEYSSFSHTSDDGGERDSAERSLIQKMMISKV